MDIDATSSMTMLNEIDATRMRKLAVNFKRQVSNRLQILVARNCTRSGSAGSYRHDPGDKRQNLKDDK